MSYTWASWQSCRRCSDGPSPGGRALLAWGLETFPTARSLGVFVCRPVRGGQGLSIHACGRAVDFGFPMIGGRANPDGHRLVARLGEHGRRLGVQAAIFDRRIWSATSPQGRRYDGVAPHRDHVHAELNITAGARLTLATLRAVLGDARQEAGMQARRGDHGGHVASIQRALENWRDGVTGGHGIDGVFGGDTEDAVKAYQKAAELPEGRYQPGVVDGYTAALLSRYDPAT